jgi:HSP20 family protein
MTLVKRSNGLFPGVPSLFDDFVTRDLFGTWPFTTEGSQQASMPAVNVRENENEFHLEVAAPGLKKDDFKIEVDKNVLTISSEKEDHSEEKNGSYSRREFRYASFKRSFSLPENLVNSDDIKAQYVNGVLEIHLPKREEAKPKPARTIEIG